MQAEVFVDILGADFYTGVPDSQLRPFCDYLINVYGVDSQHHVIGANEGNCAALAAGYHLATGKVPVVYLQNSGEGNLINPAASLLHREVYGIPAILVIGWRGEPGVPDEPQHIYQGAVTLKLLEDMEIPTFVIDSKTVESEARDAMAGFRGMLNEGRTIAFVIRRGGLTYDKNAEYQSLGSLCREDVIQRVARTAGEDVIVSTTGKASRELFEFRTENGQSHDKDFLTVGSMGHASSIALGIALQRPQARVWCLDGDGAMLMHMGAMAVIGAHRPANLIHVVLNNGAHETVGGMPTVAGCLDLVGLARACGYPHAVEVEDALSLEKALYMAKVQMELGFIAVKCGLKVRGDLGRPTVPPQENKTAFMKYLRSFRYEEGNR